MHKEFNDYLSKVEGVSHCTFDPDGPGVVRLHLVPPNKLKPGVPWVLIINGTDILPMNPGWAILLREFMNSLNFQEKKDLTKDDINGLVENTINKVKVVFPKAERSMLKSDLKEIVDSIMLFARHKDLPKETGFMHINDYAKYMQSPHRMDLMISSMSKNGVWHCNNKCLHCYAGDQKLGNTKELTTQEWKLIIDKLKKACVPQITFTGGEPTLRDDLVELVEYSKWFVTRLNTNGALLSKELCNDLFNASLDAVQVTLYSYNEDIHNLLVGAKNYTNTINGIKTAVNAGLNVSINTPLCSLNKNYLDLVKYASTNLGIKYFTCSGLIITGNAVNNDSKETRLSSKEIYNILKEAVEYANLNNLDIMFTSPGWIEDKLLKSLKITIPSCGAAMSNMAVTPDGHLIPCQSWLSDNDLGSLVDKDFKSLWNSIRCKKLRNKTSKLKSVCPLSMKNGL